MALNINTNLTNNYNEYLLDAKNVKGTYVVVPNYSELSALPSATVVSGSLAYCQSAVTINGITYPIGFYQYDGSAWSKTNIGEGVSVVANPQTPIGASVVQLDSLKIDESYYSLFKALTVTLSSSGWSSNTQTVVALGVTSSNNVFVAPSPSDIVDYASSGIYCSAQGTDSLTFTCDAIPLGNIIVNVFIMG